MARKLSTFLEKHKGYNLNIFEGLSLIRILWMNIILFFQLVEKLNQFDYIYSYTKKSQLAKWTT